jgi:hypothetical protein
MVHLPSRIMPKEYYLASILKSSGLMSQHTTLTGFNRPPPPAQFNRHIVVSGSCISLKLIQVNKEAYSCLGMIGKGGSSRVYRVLNHTTEVYAIKRVTLEGIDAETLKIAFGWDIIRLIGKAWTWC